MKRFKTTSAFPEPNYTQVPNDFLKMLPEMESSEVRVTLVMMRQTFGFHRDGFKMGLDELAAAAGISRNAAKDGAEAAEKRGTFRRTNPDSQTKAEWELIIDGHSLMVNDCLSDGQPLTIEGSTIDPQVGIKESIKENNKEKDFSLSEEEKAQANAKVDYIIEANKQPDNYYQGRELIRENLLIYADWYNKVSGQVMTKRVQKDWWKTLDIWREEGLTIPNLQTAWDNRIVWRKNITSPSELTADAVAIKAAGKAAPKTDPKERATILRTL